MIPHFSYKWNYVIILSMSFIRWRIQHTTRWCIRKVRCLMIFCDNWHRAKCALQICGQTNIWDLPVLGQQFFLKKLLRFLWTHFSITFLSHIYQIVTVIFFFIKNSEKCSPNKAEAELHSCTSLADIFFPFVISILYDIVQINDFFLKK